MQKSVNLDNKKIQPNRGEIAIYQTSKNEVEFKVRLEKETVWLNLDQIVTLFGRDKSVISRHIKNIFVEKELKRNSVVANFATTATDGKTYNVDYYNLDVVISVGYRVKSQLGVRFRIWVTSIIKKYILSGYVLSQKRLLETKERFHELQTAVAFLKEKTGKKELQGQEKEIINLLADYSKTLSILEKYDKGMLKKPRGRRASYRIKYEGYRQIIKQVKRNLIEKKEAGNIFGVERDGVFEGITKGLYRPLVVMNYTSHLKIKPRIYCI